MAGEEIAAAMDRARRVFAQRPGAGLSDDVPASTSWQGGLRFVSRHPCGATVESDMPREIGGTGDRATPGWLFRAGIASCVATAIAMHAASEGIRLTALDVRVASRSDSRGVLGMKEADGSFVPAAARDFAMTIRLAADGVPAERLRELARTGWRCSPVSLAVHGGAPIAVTIEAG